MVKIKKLQIGYLVKITDIDEADCNRINILQKDVYCSNYDCKEKVAYIIAHNKEELNRFLTANGYKTLKDKA